MPIMERRFYVDIAQRQARKEQEAAEGKKGK
jgi:hypothetical protein